MSLINVVGLGYIGLPTALMFASTGMKVVGTDCNRELVDSLQRGKAFFKETGLADLYKVAVCNNIVFSDKCINADIYIICVATPYEKVKRKIDPVYVVNAIQDVLCVCNNAAIIVIESTVSPGTIDKYIRPILEEGVHAAKNVRIVHAPERIIPGNMINELRSNSRTIGADCIQTGETVKELYSSFCKGEIVVTDIRTAEMTKVVENTYRDINIAFANELAKICRSDNMDVYEIIKIANMHPRVNILQPGPGVGGHCISVDPWFLVGDYPGLANIILAARKINDSMPEFVLERIHDIMKENGIQDVAKVGIYGLTYKEDVDDIRESPTLQLLQNMERHLAHGIKVYDPYIKEIIVNNQYHDYDQFLHDIELVVVMVAHSHIKKNVNKLKYKIVLDTKNVFGLDDAYRL